jgi:hypothetical protein
VRDSIKIGWKLTLAAAIAIAAEVIAYIASAAAGTTHGDLMTRRLRQSWRFHAVLLAIPLCGCMNDYLPQFGPLPADQTSTILPFVRDGITTRAECIARLGETPDVYDHGRTLIYQNLNYGVATGPTDLVLSFDAQGMLRRHALVRKPQYIFTSNT